MKSSSSLSRALKCLLIISEVSEDMVLSGSWGGGLGCLDAVWFGDDFGSIQLKSIMQRLAVLGYIELMQRVALCYCSVLMILASVSDIMQ